ncbi:hypothetical protein AMTR_s00017p00046660, partial [Amborella trichopoda]
RQQRFLDSSSGPSVDGSFRMSSAGVSPDRRSGRSIASKFMPTSRRAFKGLKDCAKKLIDCESLSYYLEDWILERMNSTSSDGKWSFKSPFLIDELRKLDYALEGVVFQQLLRMPCMDHVSGIAKEEEYLALEDFLLASADGLWRTFWHKNGPLPFFICCPLRAGSKFYTVEKAMSRGKIGGLCGAALMAKNGKDMQGQWDQVVEFALFKSEIGSENELGLSASTISEALFYGFHIILSRSLSKSDTCGDSVYLLVLDPKFGGVVKFGGDLSKLDLSSGNPYVSVANWMKNHAEVYVSPIDRIWNKLGNANWGDLGTLQLLLATFYSIIQWKGPPRKSIAALAADHSLRLQKRRIECRLTENGVTPIHTQLEHQNQGEIVELEDDTDSCYRKQFDRLVLEPNEVLVLEDSQGQKGFQIKDTLGNQTCSLYSAVSLDQPSELLTVHVGAHPSRLEPSWEDMSTWYQVQRQTKVLNILKQRGLSCIYIPEIIASGRVLHPGPCSKKSPGGRCDHPWCGTPVLVTLPVGEPLSSIIAQEGPLSSEEALRCCRDCLSALKSAASVNVQHGDISPENVVKVSSGAHYGGVRYHRYVLVSWGHAVLEDRDSPGMNLQFSSTHALQQGKLCPASDAESVVYLLYFLCGGSLQDMESIEAALQWRERCWARRVIQQQLGEVSALLKAFSDYVDSLCGTPYPVDYDIWLRRLNRVVGDSESLDRGKLVERNSIVLVRGEDVAESSGTSPLQ